MGLFNNAVFRFEVLFEGNLVHIYDEGIEEISVTNDAEDVLRRVHQSLREDFGYPEGVAGKRVQYTDSDGQVDRLLHENGVFKGFAPGPWTHDCGYDTEGRQT